LRVPVLIAISEYETLSPNIKTVTVQVMVSVLGMPDRKEIAKVAAIVPVVGVVTGALSLAVEGAD
jgi:hypothetical protein